MNSTTLLIADAEQDLRQHFANALSADGYVVVGASTEARLRTLITNTEPDLIVLGDLPGPTGGAPFIEQLRHGQIVGRPDTTPLLVLTDDGDDLAATRCLLAGADDFHTKPISAVELHARVQAILRRASTTQTLGVQGLRLDPATATATFAGEPLALSRIEFKLLTALATNPHQAQPADELLRTVWGYALPGKTRTVAAHACRLRRKLAAAGATGWIVSVRGIGYRLLDSPNDPTPDAAA